MPAPNNPSLIDTLRTHFVQSYTPTTAWGNALSLLSALPKLRGLWLYTPVGYSGTFVYENGPLHRDLSCSPTFASTNFGHQGLVPYVDLVRASSEYLYRADEGGLDIGVSGVDITGSGLTMYTWAWFDSPSTGNATNLIGKWDSAGGNLRSYVLYKDASNILTFSVSSLGTAGSVYSVTDSGANYAISTWFFLCARWTPSTELALFVNNNKYTNVTSIPANLFNSTYDFRIGSHSGGVYLDGREALTVLCADAHDDFIVRSVFHHTRALFGV